MRKFNVTVNGKTYEVEVEELGGTLSMPAPAPVQAEAPTKVAPAVKPENKEVKTDKTPAKKEAAVSAAGGEVISCPMPGTILTVNVKEGDMVKRGDVLFILEAMKMENEIMSPRDGKIVSVGVNKGASVNTGDMLAVIA